MHYIYLLSALTLLFPDFSYFSIFPLLPSYTSFPSFLSTSLLSPTQLVTSLLTPSPPPSFPRSLPFSLLPLCGCQRTHVAGGTVVGGRGQGEGVIS